MRILILGGDSMLGWQLLLYLQNKHDVKVTLRNPESNYKTYSVFNEQNSYYNVDVHNFSTVGSTLLAFKPDIVINSIGIVKQNVRIKNITSAIEINALFPHKLSQLCQSMNTKLIQLSTDCVFNGKKGGYTENETGSADDIYGQTKYLGEVRDAKHCLTLRKSLIGLELKYKYGLIEWFLAQQASIKGYQQALYSGFTTREMSRIIDMIITKHPTLSGVWHIASQPISKYQLLTTLANKLKLKNIHIEADNDFVCYRHLNGDRFTKATGYQAPSWDSMLTELTQEIKRRG